LGPAIRRGRLLCPRSFLRAAFVDSYVLLVYGPSLSLLLRIPFTFRACFEEKSSFAGPFVSSAVLCCYRSGDVRIDRDSELSPTPHNAPSKGFWYFFIFSPSSRPYSASPTVIPKGTPGFPSLPFVSASPPRAHFAHQLRFVPRLLCSPDAWLQ